MAQIHRALTIAGSDSGGGAGIQADLKSFSALGVYGASVLTAITAQNTLGVTAIQELPKEIVQAQIDAVLQDIGADAVKTGMIANSEIIEVISRRLRHYDVTRLVVDPVMVAKSGDALLRPEAVETLRRKLIPLAAVVTPNLPEAETLTEHPVRTPEAMRAAAREIVLMGARAAVVKGGHLEGPTAVDVLFDGSEFSEFSSKRVDTRNTHGTGCTFASAIAAYLARGEDVYHAVGSAKRYLSGALMEAYDVGAGHGPVHHFWQLWPR